MAAAHGLVRAPARSRVRAPGSATLRLELLLLNTIPQGSSPAGLVFYDNAAAPGYTVRIRLPAMSTVLLTDGSTLHTKWFLIECSLKLIGIWFSGYVVEETSSNLN
jgi:hypothetical protein